ncbi:copper-binding protein [Egibacter rhizosphaerae]|uniref:Copper-binding protein n=1 Tax=Egibacter rhizosphaerae TaxID=1670831 RepID=A0A411YFF2_9ACTN|nr:plastocyanin/azurin family copper-binding protein [Egibacter rhizosphaerae]QBI19958.1 copper-binding protein [Egibacter rhizosphaerae]
MPRITMSRRRAAHLVAVTAALSLVLAACGQAGSTPTSEDPVQGTEVSVVDNAFEPEVLEVEVGETVTWNWEGTSAHNVSGDGFESPLQEEGTFTHTFEEPGEYDYTCTPHGGMDGTVVVVEP